MHLLCISCERVCSDPAGLFLYLKIAWSVYMLSSTRVDQQYNSRASSPTTHHHMCNACWNTTFWKVGMCPICAIGVQQEAHLKGMGILQRMQIRPSCQPHLGVVCRARLLYRVHQWLRTCAGEDSQVQLRLAQCTRCTPLQSWQNLSATLYRCPASCATPAAMTPISLC